MTKKRKLTEAEKAELAKLQLTVEQLRYPGHEIDITVYDETDDEGQARMLIVKQNEVAVAPGAKALRPERKLPHGVGSKDGR